MQPSNRPQDPDLVTWATALVFAVLLVLVTVVFTWALSAGAESPYKRGTRTPGAGPGAVAADSGVGDGGDAAPDGGDAAADGGDAQADGGDAEHPDAPADGGDAEFPDALADGGDAAADGGDAAADGGDASAPTLAGPLTLTPGDTQIALDWPNGSGSTQYYDVRVLAGTTPPTCTTGSAPTGCSVPAVSNCTATGLTNSSDYAFAVCANDNGGGRSAAVTASAQPFVDALGWTFDGCDTAGGCAGTEEFVTVADNAVLECGAHLTLVMVASASACVNGTTCDDIMLIKGTTTNDSYSVLQEFVAGGWRPRIAVGGLAIFGQYTTILVAINRYAEIVATYDGTQVDGGDAGSDANAERLSGYGAACDGSTPPVCAALTDRALTFNGTIPTTISDQATIFAIGGQTATRFNFPGTITEAAVYCDGKVAMADAQACLFDGTHARLNNLNAMSGACNTAFAHPAWWGRFGDKPSDSAATQLGNGFANALGNMAPQAMESGDQAAHSN